MAIGYHSAFNFYNVVEESFFLDLMGKGHD